MKTSNFGIIALINTLNKYGSKKLPQKISYSITRNLMTLQKEYECYNESFNKLIGEYSEHIKRDGEGNMVFTQNGVPVVEGECHDDFENELYELLNIEVDISIKTVDEDVFDYDDCNGRYDILTVNDIIALQKIICEE